MHPDLKYVGKRVWNPKVYRIASYPALEIEQRSLTGIAEVYVESLCLTLFSLTGLLNPLDCPHHMRVDDESEYREGVVLDRPIRSTGKFGSYVDCGMRKVVN